MSDCAPAPWQSRIRTQLIARRVREIGIYCELLPYDVDDDFIKKFNPKGVILSGGPDTVTLNDSARAPQIVFDLGVPILGICSIFSGNHKYQQQNALRCVFLA
jgi:GMP synthase-like glutamine amidotransferase